MAKRRYKALSGKSKDILAEKRRAAKILREAGLLRRRAGRITRQYLEESSHFRSVRRQFADLLTGEVRAARINSRAAAMFRRAGYRVKREGRGISRVIVAKAERRPSPLKAPPPAPAPPPKSRAARLSEEDHRFEDCLQRVLAWFQVNATEFPDQRAERLIRYATENKREFKRIINRSHADGLRYLQGLPPTHQTEFPEDEDNEIAELFKEEFPELYYYSPSSYDGMVAGGLIPKC